MGESHRAYGQLKLFVVLAGLGIAAQFYHVRIPHTEVLIEGRWAFGFIGFALLRRWWAALLLAVVLSTPLGTDVSLLIGWPGNLLYALPALVFIRALHPRVLQRLGPGWAYGVAWGLMVMFCYEVFTTPAVWGVVGWMNGEPIIAKVVAGWVTQPFLTEGVLVSSFSAVAMVAALTLERLRANQRRLKHINQVLLGIRNVNQLIVEESDPRELVGRACANLTETMGYRTAWMVRFTPGSGQVDQLAHAGLGGDFDKLRERIEKGIFPDCMRRALDANETIIIPDPHEQCGDCPVARCYDDRAVLGRSVQHEGTSYGVLMASVPSAYAGDPEEQALLDEVAGDLGYALHKIEAAQRLHESQCMLERTERIANIGSWEWQIEGDRVTWSDGLFRIFGLEPTDEAPCFAEHQHLYVPGDREQLVQAVEECVRSGTPYELELRVQRPGGEIRNCLVRGLAERGPDGRVHRLMGSLQDITDLRRTEEALRESSTLLSKAEQLSRSGAWRFDVQSRTSVISQNWQKLVGLPSPVVDWEDLWSLLPEQERPRLEAALQDALAGVAPYNIEHDLVRKSDGQRITIHSLGEVVRDGDGNPVSIFGVSQDITQRKQAERDLQAREAFLDRIIEQSPFATWISDANGVLQRANPALKKALNLTDERLVGKYNVLEDPFVEKHGLMPLVRSVFERGETVHFSCDWDGNDIPTLDLKGSKSVSIEATMFPVLNPAGEITNVVLHWIDITARKEAEDALRASEEKYRTLIDRIQAAVVVHAPDTSIVASNPKARELLGVTEDQLLGKIATDPQWQFLDTEGDELRPESFPVNRVLATGQPVEDLTLAICRPRSGDEVWVLVNAVPVFDDAHELEQVIVTFADITERRQAEKERQRLQEQLAQSQKMESVGRLAGGVAHDFNNMLNVILGHAEIVLDDLPTDSSLRTDLQEIQRAAERSADLTRQLLAFARKQTVAPRTLDLNETIASMLKMLRRLIGEDIDLLWKPAEGLGPVRIDPGQVDQVLANLAVNARDAIGRNVGRVTIETGNASFDEAYCAAHAGFLPGDYVMLAVSDDGCGMDEATRDRLFEPFFTTKRIGEGTGLGLATVYGIVKQNRGFINVYSEPRQGTIFRIYLPRETRHSTEPDHGEIVVPATTSGNETVLLVEDEPSILSLGTRMLERLGYEVLAANTPREAIRIAREYPGEIHVLVTDVVMPEMNGRDLAKRLLALYPNLRRLFMSGYTANVVAHHGVLDEGINFLQKPFSLNSLTVKLREVLDS